MKRAVFLPHIYELSKQNNISIEEALLITRNEGYTGVDANWADISSKSPELKKQLKNANINIASICTMNKNKLRKTHLPALACIPVCLSSTTSPIIRFPSDLPPKIRSRRTKHTG